MQELLRIQQEILARGKVDSDHIASLQKAAYTGGKVTRAAADFLVELYKRVQHRNPAFEQLFYRAIKDHVLDDGRISAQETAWLQQMLFNDGKIQDEERKFMHELKGEAREACPEFEALFKKCMKEPKEQHTSR
ncbi:MAG: hypothetical protein U0796_15940 [Gemmatales bacterium]